RLRRGPRPVPALPFFPAARRRPSARHPDLPRQPAGDQRERADVRCSSMKSHISPLALIASGLMCDFMDEHRLTRAECEAACGVAHYVREVEESKELTANPAPKVIISASGMATGGRVLHHLKRFAPDG